MPLTITQESPEAALFFGVVAVITGALLSAILSGVSIPSIILIILGAFWIVTGVIALWFGFKYLRIRQ